MPNYAVISGPSIINTIVTDDKEEFESKNNLRLIEIDVHSGLAPGVGWIYDEETNTFSRPESEG